MNFSRQFVCTIINCETVCKAILILQQQRQGTEDPFLEVTTTSLREIVGLQLDTTHQIKVTVNCLAYAFTRGSIRY